MKVKIMNLLNEKQKILQNLVHFTGHVFSIEITNIRSFLNFFPIAGYLLNYYLQKCLSVTTAVEYLRIFIVLQ